MKPKSWLVGLVVLFNSLLCQFAGAQIFVPEHWAPPHIQPHPLPPTQFPAWTPIEISFSKINAKVRDQIASTTVETELYNPNPQRLEGTFLFPVLKGAHLDKFAMEMDGKMVDAELLNADKARHIYEDIVRRLRDPGLLEFCDRDVFKLRVFPIEPNGHKRIKLSYTQLLASDAGIATYVFPLNTAKFSAKPVKTVSIKINLETKRPLKSVYSPSHNVEIKRNGDYSAVVGYESSDVRPDKDFQLLFSEEDSELGLDLLTHKTGEHDGYFLLLATPSARLKHNEIIAKDIAFVLDTSGSMAGMKLEQAKKALRFCVENLNAKDRFEIIRFSTEVEPLFEKLVDASARNRERANEFIDDLKPIGGTAIDEALQKALALRSGDSDRPFFVIFLTDGLPTIGTTDEEEILAHAKHASDGRTRIFCFGIGTDVNTHLLDKIADHTKAFSQYVLPEEDLEVKLSSFYTKIKEPVLANTKITFPEGVRVTKLYPSPLPDLFKGEQLVLAGRYSGHGRGKVVVEGTINGETKRFSYEVKFRDENTDNDFIPRLWAMRRVGYLLDEIRLHGESGELRDEVTELARKYGIVTPYTAYLILEDERRRDVPMAMQALPQLHEDSGLATEAAKRFEGLAKDKSGDLAVDSARSGFYLKNSVNATYPAAPAEASVAGGRYSTSVTGSQRSATAQLAPTRKLDSQVVQSAQQNQFVNGKNFYQNGAQWIDSDAQSVKNLARIRIQFNSREYFDFAAKEPTARPWLALGQNVQFVLRNTVYEIYE